MAYLYTEQTETEEEGYIAYGETESEGLSRREYVEKGSSVEDVMKGLKENQKPQVRICDFKFRAVSVQQGLFSPEYSAFNGYGQQSCLGKAYRESNAFL